MQQQHCPKCLTNMLESYASQQVEKQKQRDAKMVRGRAGEFDSASWVTSRHVGSLLNELATAITVSEKGVK